MNKYITKSSPYWEHGNKTIQNLLHSHDINEFIVINVVTGVIHALVILVIVHPKI